MKTDKCPWCEIKLIDLWEYSLDDGDSYDTECPNCEKKINIQLDISYDYTIKRTGCEHHFLDMPEYYALFSSKIIEFKCTNCHEEFCDWMLPNGKYPKMKWGQFTFVGEAIEVAKKLNLKNEP